MAVFEELGNNKPIEEPAARTPGELDHSGKATGRTKKTKKTSISEAQYHVLMNVVYILVMLAVVAVMVLAVAYGIDVFLGNGRP